MAGGAARTTTGAAISHRTLAQAANPAAAAAGAADPAAMAAIDPAAVAKAVDPAAAVEPVDVEPVGAEPVDPPRVPRPKGAAPIRIARHQHTCPTYTSSAGRLPLITGCTTEQWHRQCQEALLLWHVGTFQAARSEMHPWAPWRCTSCRLSHAPHLRLRGHVLRRLAVRLLLLLWTGRSAALGLLSVAAERPVVLVCAQCSAAAEAALCC